MIGNLKTWDTLKKVHYILFFLYIYLKRERLHSNLKYIFLTTFSLFMVMTILTVSLSASTLSQRCYTFGCYGKITLKLKLSHKKMKENERWFAFNLLLIRCSIIVYKYVFFIGITNLGLASWSYRKKLRYLATIVLGQMMQLYW